MMHAQLRPRYEVEPRRRVPRIEICAPVKIREFGRSAVDACLINISSRGFMAMIDVQIPTRARIWLTLNGQRVNARVVWSKHGRIGAEFAEPQDRLVAELIPG